MSRWLRDRTASAREGERLWSGLETQADNAIVYCHCVLSDLSRSVMMLLAVGVVSGSAGGGDLIVRWATGGRMTLELKRDTRSRSDGGAGDCRSTLLAFAEEICVRVR